MMDILEEGQRISRVGRFLRRYRIDELQQIFNPAR
jgi:lipopolysaccharide/colanic/teichoic acid biosynthesis glycosyltransferase